MPADVGFVFPQTAVLAVSDGTDRESPLTIGVVGHEGFVGWSTLTGVPTPAFTSRVMMQGGTAMGASAATVQRLAADVPAFRAAMLRFVDCFMHQMGRTIVACLRDGVDKRLARWLLLLHDRVEGDDLPVTHADLSSALNVRRASVTDCLHVMEGERIVRCVRGRVPIRDRARLRAMVGDSYGAAEQACTQATGAFGKG